MKSLIISLALLVVCLAATVAAGEYNTSYCHDPVELQRWNDLRAENPDSEFLTAIHALWIGLCVKVEAMQLTTNQANQLFELFREALIEQIEQQQLESKGKKS